MVGNKKFKVRLNTGVDISANPIITFKFLDKKFKIKPAVYILEDFEGTKESYRCSKFTKQEGCNC